MVRILFGRVTVAGLLVVLVVGCGHAAPGRVGEAGPGPAGGVTGAPDSGVPNPGALNPGAPNPGAPNPGVPNLGVPNPGAGTPGLGTDDTKVAWVPFGPGSEFRHRVGSPNPPYQGTAAGWNRAFRNHDCDAIAALGPERDQRQLYAGLGDACRAVLKKNHQLWISAEAALRHVDDPTDCLDRLALRLLRDLVMTHQRAPHADIHIVDPPPGTACGPDNSPTRPTSVAPTSTPTSVIPSGTPQTRATPPHRPSAPPG
jgi:hypothetical protein